MLSISINTVIFLKVSTSSLLIICIYLRIGQWTAELNLL